jgi:hypothetical protein
MFDTTPVPVRTVETRPMSLTLSAALPRAVQPRRRRPIAALLAVAALLALPTAASATLCASQPTTEAFSSVGDTASYALAPGGDFETGTHGWGLKNAKLTSGNETLGILPGTHSLTLGGGLISGVATVSSPVFCVDNSHPYFRYALKANGMVGLMSTYIKYLGPSGSWLTALIPSRVSTNLLPGKWAASALNPLSINIPLVLLGGTTAAVQLVWSSPISILGGYQIDDVLVDPYRHR